MNQEERFMREAIRQARKVYALDEVPTGVLEEECSKMLSGFFRELRQKKANSGR